MTPSTRSFATFPATRTSVLMLGALVAAAAASASAQPPTPWRNATAGGPLRPGVYGRIVLKGAPPPPVIYPRPVVADGVPPPDAQPVYLYVPPGQVRKWKQNCARWSACEQPVLFVRMDESPSRWGQWRVLRETTALQGHG